MTKTRIETDNLGSRELPADALFGISALRGSENFNISGQKLGNEPELLRAMARIKRAAAGANHEIAVIPAGIAEAIAAAAREVEAGRHADQFVVDLLEGSGGTSINMNVNEVIANRALQLLGRQPGSYERVQPNDHVNAGQSTNDVVPSAIKLALYEMMVPLLDALGALATALEERAGHFDGVLRLGRTCMQSAQPMRLGQAFGGYGAAIRRCIAKLDVARDDLLVLPLGGTAIGTGLGAAPGYRAAVYRHLGAIVGAQVLPGADMFDAMQNADTFARLSSEIRICAEVIGKIAADLVILSSDGDGGLGELRLPAVQAGSSIMPGKVNPVLPMMMQQVAFSIIGNDAVVSVATLHGQLEINHFEPVTAARLFDSARLLTKSTRIFAQRCIAGIEADEKRSLDNLAASPALATVFVEQHGYVAVSQLVSEAAQTGKPFVELAMENGLMSRDTLREALHRSTEHGK